MKKLEVLQSLRAVAALGVVLFHLSMVHRHYHGRLPFFGIFTSGWRGVDLFFVLSGFIILTIHRSDINQIEQLPRYLFKRISRVYPSVFIVTVVSYLIYRHGFVSASHDAKLSVWGSVASVLLLPQLSTPLVNVTWTLTYEIAFYLGFALLLVSRRLGLCVLLMWQLASFLFSCLYPGERMTLATYYLQPIVLDFGIGMGAALLCTWLQSRGRSYRIAASLTVGISATSLILLSLMPSLADFTTQKLPSTLAYGLACAALIIALVRLEGEGYIKVPSVIVLLGDASFSIYLVHFAVISLFERALRHAAGQAQDTFALLLALLAIAAGIGFHLGIDAPIQAALQAWQKRGADPQLAPALPKA